MLKILQARLQQYVNRELPDVQAGFKKGRGTRDKIAKEARIYNGVKTISLTSGAGKTGQPLVTNETRSLSNTAHKNKLKMD